MSMLRNWLTYMGLGPDEDYDDRYLYERGGRGPHDDEEESHGSSSRVREPRSRQDGRGARQRTPDRPSSRRLHNASYSFDEIDLRQDEDESELEIPKATPSARRLERDARVSGGPFEDGPDRQRQQQPRVRPLRSVPAPPKSGDIFEQGSDEPLAGGGYGGGDVTPIRGASRFVKPELVTPTSFSDAQTVADIFKSSIPVVLSLSGVDRLLSQRLLDFASGVCYVMSGAMEKVGPAAFLLIPDSVEVSPEDRRGSWSRSQS